MAIRRALISVSDKTGIVEFSRALAGLGVQIISTGGTASLLEKEGVPVVGISEVTGFPEILDGRVKRFILLFIAACLPCAMTKSIRKR